MWNLEIKSRQDTKDKVFNTYPSGVSSTMLLIFDCSSSSIQVDCSHSSSLHIIIGLNKLSCTILWLGPVRKATFGTSKIRVYMFLVYAVQTV